MSSKRNINKDSKPLTSDGESDRKTETETDSDDSDDLSVNHYLDRAENLIRHDEIMDRNERITDLDDSSLDSHESFSELQSDIYADNHYLSDDSLSGVSSMDEYSSSEEENDSNSDTENTEEEEIVENNTQT